MQSITEPRAVATGSFRGTQLRWPAVGESYKTAPLQATTSQRTSGEAATYDIAVGIESLTLYSTAC
jgi:hypothetical protein